MNTADTECLPPPLPAEITDTPESAASTRATAHLRRWPWLWLAAAGAAVAVDVVVWSKDFVQAGPGGYGAALATLFGAGAMVAMRRDLDFKNPLWAMLAATAVASAWLGSTMSVWLAFALMIALVRRPTAGGEAAGVPWIFTGPILWCGALAGAFGALISKVFRGRSSSWLAAVVTGGFFLILLTFGNAALAKYVGSVTDGLANLIHIRSEDMGRLVLWGAGILSLGGLAAPRPAPAREGIMVETPAKPSPIAFATLIGANVAFLASNLTDTYWIGFMRSAPEGVSTTKYLYDGGYVLMLDAAIAGALLLKLFAADGEARGDRRANLAGRVLIAQCAWLGLGVAGRLALQMDKFGFTPVRLWGVVFLAWGFVGLFGVWRHLKNTPSLRRFVRLVATSALFGLCALQFRPPTVLSVDLNLACHTARPEWKFDVGYYQSVGHDGWRLYRSVPLEVNEGAGVIMDAYWRSLFEGGETGRMRRTGLRNLDWRVRNLRDDALVSEWKAVSKP
jgi:hypothetical protein